MEPTTGRKTEARQAGDQRPPRAFQKMTEEMKGEEQGPNRDGWTRNCWELKDTEKQNGKGE